MRDWNLIAGQVNYANIFVTTKEIPKRELRVSIVLSTLPLHVLKSLVTTKEIPKRELRARLMVKHCSPQQYILCVTTKEIPKRELRVCQEFVTIIYPEEFGLQQKKSQKGNWEPKNFRQLIWRYYTIPVTTKEIPKRELRDDALQRFIPARIGPALQQKKSQKGNWEPVFGCICYCVVSLC